MAVDDGDTVKTLKEKVLQAEHKILVQAVKLFCDSKISIEERIVRIIDKE